MNRPYTWPPFAAGRGRFAPQTAYRLSMMAFGAVYFPLRAGITVAGDWVRRNVDKEKA